MWSLSLPPLITRRSERSPRTRLLRAHPLKSALMFPMWRSSPNKILLKQLKSITLSARTLPEQDVFKQLFSRSQGNKHVWPHFRLHIWHEWMQKAELFNRVPHTNFDEKTRTLRLRNSARAKINKIVDRVEIKVESLRSYRQVRVSNIHNTCSKPKRRLFRNYLEI